MASRHFHPYNGDVQVPHPHGQRIPEGCRQCGTPTQSKYGLCHKHRSKRNKGGCRR